MPITPEFLSDLESNMQVISEDAYTAALQNIWWREVAKEMQTKSKKERLIWLLNTAQIERPNASKGGGQAIFEELVTQTTEYEVENAIAGLKIKKERFEDLDGGGLDLAAQWAADVGAEAALWPQQQVADAIKANPVTYDGKTFFSAIADPHFVNPFNEGAGSFANHFTGAAAGDYPGALPIHAGAGGVTADVALENLEKAIAYIATIPMPNGKTPRRLKVRGILHPPAMAGRVAQITDAKFIAQAATGGAGSGDVEAVIRRLGLATPIQAEELAAAFDGSNTDYYLLAEQIQTSRLGAFTYVNREPFSAVYHGEMTDAQLARIRELQWTTEGRNIVGAGHPYLLFKCSAT